MMNTEAATADTCELHDKQLFEQPDGSFLGECPICCLPLQLDFEKVALMNCCSKFICEGCNYANQMREGRENLKPRCAFCREPMPKSKEEIEKNTMKRIKKNDPVAFCHMGKTRYIEGDYGKALEYLAKASEMGDIEAHYYLASLYENGHGVEKDMKKAVYHLEQAAIGGHAWARDLLADNEMKNGRVERAARHYIIAAILGFEPSLKCVKRLFMRGMISKEDYGAALRGYQSTVEAAKSQERENAEKVTKGKGKIIYNPYN